MLTLALTVAMSGGQEAVGPEPVFVLITTDSKPWQRWTGDVNAENLREKFPEDEYTIIDAERGVFTVIDHDLPIIESQLRWIGLSTVFSDMADPSAPLEIGSLNESDKKWVEDAMSMMQPRKYWQEGFDFDSASVALRPRLSVAIETNGQWHYVKLPAQSYEINQARNSALASRPVRVKPSSQIQEELAREAEKVDNPPDKHTPAPTLFVYRSYPSLKSAAYVTAIKALQELEADLKTRVDDVVNSLKDRMNLTELEGFGGMVPNGKINIGRLPDNHRTRIERNFVGSWRFYGFASKDEAQIAFSQVTTVNYQFEVSLVWSTGMTVGNRARSMRGVVFYHGN